MDGVQSITRYFSLTAEQESLFEQLLPLYAYWNERINVISRRDMDNFYVSHVLHSLGISKVHPLPDGSRVLDVGTGGGFPGIPLAILHPEVSFHLVDSIGKKIRVVNEVTSALKLQNVHTSHTRAETLEERYGYIISRAVTRMQTFYGWVEHLLTPGTGGILYLKGGDLDEEMSEAGVSYKSYNLKDEFEEDFFETKKVIYIPA